MHVDELPLSRLVGKARASEPHRLTSHIVGAAFPFQRRFTHMAMVEGAPRSGRLLFQAEPEGIEAIAYEKPFGYIDIAKEFEKMVKRKEARFYPPEQPTPHDDYGFEVHSVDINGERAVLVWTAWVDVSPIIVHKEE